MARIRHVLHRNRPAVFQGRPSRVYDLVARRPLRGVYRRLGTDIAQAAPTGGAVLDVGTGPGVLLLELARQRPDLRLSGVDLSSDMVAATTRNLERARIQADIRVGDVTDLPHPDQAFDLIVSTLSAHHWDEPQAAVPQLARVLRPGGRLRVYDFGVAPFDLLASAAASEPRFAGQSPHRTPVRAGIWPFSRLVRWELASAPTG